MSDWSDELGFLLSKAGKTAAAAVKAVGSAFDDDPYEILCYRGYGNESRAWVYGRVVERRKIGLSADSDSTFRNLLNTYRRADSDPLPRAEVKVSWRESAVEMKADDDGFFGGWINSATAATDEWEKYEAVLSADHGNGDPIKGEGEILVPKISAAFGVISDIDDTVIQSRVSSFLQAARTVMLGNARTRLPFPGVAAFYRALSEGAKKEESNPVFYVSSSPWNIYDVIAEFMDLQKIPKGPILLRDWDISLGALSSTRHFEHKGVAIQNILELYPALPFVLVGDSSQHDPEIYRRIVKEFPGRIKVIYIRDVVRSAERVASVKKLADEILADNSSLVLADDTLGAAKHAADNGLIDPASLPDIGEEKKADEGQNDSKVPTPEGGEAGTSAPPVVVGTVSEANPAAEGRQ